MSKLRLIFTALSFLAILLIYAFFYITLQSSFEDSGNKAELYTQEVPSDLTTDQQFIAEQLELTNYCEVTDDCVDAGSFCPLTCQSFVNVSRVDDIKQLMSKFEQACRLDCYVGTPRCKNNKCIVE